MLVVVVEVVLSLLPEWEEGVDVDVEQDVVGCAPIPGTKELTRDGKSTRRTIQ